MAFCLLAALLYHSGVISGEWLVALLGIAFVEMVVELVFDEL